MPKITKKLQKLVKPTGPRVPLWKGPREDGITQSMLNYFLACRERFRLYYIEGWSAPPTFIAAIEYGHMWHLCEEIWAKDLSDKDGWIPFLRDYTEGLLKQYPLQTDQVLKWYNVCLVQFPVYQNYWKDHPHQRNRTPLLKEVCFRVPYHLPSGDRVILRGKWDSVDLIKLGAKREVWLQDHKTKYEINDEKIHKQLEFDLQSMFYLIALRYAMENDQYESLGKTKASWLKGIIYNVVRRPLSGGKGSIRQHQPTKSKPEGESLEEYYARLAGIIQADPDDYFARWEVRVFQPDILRFEQRVLQPLLQQVVDWYDYMCMCDFDPWKDPRRFACNDCLREYSQIHWQHPYGTYNVLNEGGSTEYDEFLKTGSTLRLERTAQLFPELDPS